MISDKSFRKDFPILHIIVDAIESGLTQINCIPFALTNINRKPQVLCKGESTQFQKVLQKSDQVWGG